MLTDMIAYLLWIVLLVGGLGAFFRSQQAGRPRPARVVLRRRERRLRKADAVW